MNSINMSLFFLVVVSAFFRPGVVQADEGEKILLDGVDITAFVDYYRPAVKTFNKSVTVFNWSAEAKEPFWAEGHGDDSFELAENVRKRSQSFWRHFGNKNGSMDDYGYGLYAAVDPVLTYYFGKDAASWVLLQMELPVGFKMIDVSNNLESTQPAKEKMQLIANQFRCPQSEGLSALFQYGGMKLDMNCRKLVQKVFADILEIDGFAYYYARTLYKACQGESMKSNVAFVITNQNWIRPENLKSFTSNTVSNREDRIRIQTLFLSGGGSPLFITTKVISSLSRNPEKFVRRTSIACETLTCKISAELCNAQNSCENLMLDPFPLSTGVKMTSSAAANTEPRALLWPDMEGDKMSPAIHQWLQENKYGCSGSLPF